MRGWRDKEIKSNGLKLNGKERLQIKKGPAERGLLLAQMSSRNDDGVRGVNLRF